jgi:hypothetical protein
MGKPPWSEKKDIFTVLLNIASAQEMPKIPSNVSPDLKNFIEICLNRDP